VIYSSDGKAEFSASLLLSSVSHDPSCRNHSSIMIKKEFWGIMWYWRLE